MKDAASHGVGWTPAILLAVAVVTGASFLRRQKRVPNPLVQTELFRSAVFSTAMTANSLALLAWVGASLLVTQHIQLVLALSAMPAAMWMLPSALACVAGCLAAPGLARRWWNGRVITLGLFLSTLGLAALAASAARFGLAAIVPAMMVLGFGVSLVVTLSTDIILSGAPADLAGSASSPRRQRRTLGARWVWPFSAAWGWRCTVCAFRFLRGWTVHSKHQQQTVFPELCRLPRLCRPTQQSGSWNRPVQPTAKGLALLRRQVPCCSSLRPS
jgi:hypothetical protein